MKVYKFGGASVKSAEAVRNVCKIVQSSSGELLVVVSAMGKTTNALEDVVFSSFKNQDVTEKVNAIREFHLKIAGDLLPNSKKTIDKIDNLLNSISSNLDGSKSIDRVYDQIVSTGELLSTIIVCDYLATLCPALWLDARDYIVTNSTFKEGKVDWELTHTKIQSLSSKIKNSIIVTQGFIGRSELGFTTTLGREGSDYSAAIFASCLGAESVTIWKDVPGVMTADPKRLVDATTFDELPFREAAEMTYYGASVIHPKTIKPLANAGIPLFVKNFDDPSLPGTRIHECRIDHIPPLIVFKENQCLISCKVTDYTFVSEDQLSLIFNVLAQQGVKINLMQNSAISFSFCSDYHANKINKVIELLSQSFEVYYNTALTLITIKNYTSELSAEYRSKVGVLLEQTSRSTLQILIRGNAAA